jgi:hypothetical protein
MKIRKVTPCNRTAIPIKTPCLLTFEAVPLKNKTVVKIPKIKSWRSKSMAVWKTASVPNKTAIKFAYKTILEKLIIGFFPLGFLIL